MEPLSCCVCEQTPYMKGAYLFCDTQGNLVKPVSTSWCFCFCSLQSCKRTEAELWRWHPERLAHCQEETLEQHWGEAHQPGEWVACLSDQTYTGWERKVRLLMVGSWMSSMCSEGITSNRLLLMQRTRRIQRETRWQSKWRRCCQDFIETCMFLDQLASHDFIELFIIML